MEGLRLMVLALAVWRVSAMVTAEEGPGDLFVQLRHAAGVRYDERSRVVAEGSLAKLLTCPWCMSVWVGAGWTLAYALWPEAAIWVALPFALSAAAVGYGRLTGG